MCFGKYVQSCMHLHINMHYISMGHLSHISLIPLGLLWMHATFMVKGCMVIWRCWFWYVIYIRSSMWPLATVSRVAFHAYPTFSMRKLFPPFGHIVAFGALPFRVFLVILCPFVYVCLMVSCFIVGWYDCEFIWNICIICVFACTCLTHFMIVLVCIFYFVLIMSYNMCTVSIV